MRSARLVLSLCALAVACNRDYTYDEGAICVDAEALAMWSEGDALEIRIVLDPCISACARDVDVSCDIEVEGKDVLVDARGSWHDPGSNTCVTLCAELAAMCSIAGLPEGTYTIRSGDRSLQVTLPSAEPPMLDTACPGA